MATISLAMACSSGQTEAKDPRPTLTEGETSPFDRETSLEEMLDYLGSPSARVGRELFAMKCTECHGRIGAEGEAAPDLFVRSWLSRESVERGRETIMHGREGKMPAFGNRLPPRQIDDLLGYIVLESTSSRAPQGPGPAP